MMNKYFNPEIEMNLFDTEISATILASDALTN